MVRHPFLHRFDTLDQRLTYLKLRFEPNFLYLVLLWSGLIGGMGARITIVLGSELPQVSRFITNSFKVTSDLSLVGVALDEMELVHMAKLHRPNIAIVNLNLRPAVLSTLIVNLSAHGVSPLIMSDSVDDVEALELLQSGLVGIIPSRVTSEMLCHCVRATAAGEIWIQRKMIGRLIEQLRETSGNFEFTRSQERSNRPKPQIDNQFSLTQRELQIVQATSEGKTNKEIAFALGISDFTVKHHLAKIFDKLGVYSRLELATFAVHHDLYRKLRPTEFAVSLHSAETASRKGVI